MADWANYEQSRRRTEELPGGFTVLLGQPNMKRALLAANSGGGLEPAYFAKLTVLRASGQIIDKPAPDNPEELKLWRQQQNELALARLDDLLALAAVGICDAAINPRMFLTAELASAYNAKRKDSDPFGMCVFDLAESDRVQLEAACFALLDLSHGEAEQIAPFPESADAGAAGGAAELQPEQSAGEAAG